MESPKEDCKTDTESAIRSSTFTGFSAFNQPQKSTVNSDFIRSDLEASTAEDDLSFIGKLRSACKKALNSQAYLLWVGVIVTLDTCLRVVDIDTRASGQKTALWVIIPLRFCLASYCAEFATFLFVHGRAGIQARFSFLFDCAVVLTAIAEVTVAAAFGMTFAVLGLQVLNIIRIGRVFRMFRIFVRFKELNKLRKLSYMAASCASTLFWGMCFLFLTTTFWAMVTVELVGPFMADVAGKGYWDGCATCQDAISSVMKANLLLYSSIMAGDSWGQLPRPLALEHPWTIFIWVGSSVTLQFGVCNMIVAVIVDAFAEDRQKNIMSLAQDLEWEQEDDRKFLEVLFQKMDADGSQSLSFEELLRGAQKHPEFHSRLRVMDIDEADLRDLFELLDQDGSGEVDSAEFVGALSRWLVEPKTATRFIKSHVVRLIERQSSFEAVLLKRIQALEKMICNESVSGQKLDHFLEQISEQIRSLKGTQTVPNLDNCIKKDKVLYSSCDGPVLCDQLNKLVRQQTELLSKLSESFSQEIDELRSSSSNEMLQVMLPALPLIDSSPLEVPALPKLRAFLSFGQPPGESSSCQPPCIQHEALPLTVPVVIKPLLSNGQGCIANPAALAVST